MKKLNASNAVDPDKARRLLIIAALKLRLEMYKTYPKNLEYEFQSDGSLRILIHTFDLRDLYQIAQAVDLSVIIHSHRINDDYHGRLNVTV